MPETLTRARVDYEEDFHAWLMEQAALARAGRTSALDLENIAEELEGLARSDRREIESRLERILEPLLKLAFVPGEEPRRGWRATIREQRRRLELLLADSPSLAGHSATALQRCYELALLRLGRDRRTRDRPVLETCPFTIEQVMDSDFVPEAPGGD